MDNNKKKKIMIGSAIGVILLLLIIVSVAYSKGKTNNEVEVANTEKVNIDNVINEVADASWGNIVDDIKEKDKIEEVTPEPTDTEKVNTETPNKEEVTNTDTVYEENEPYIPPTTTTSNDFGTPQEYHGDPEGRGPGRIIVKGFNYDSYGWRGEYWTASNGVEIKIASVDGKETGMIPVPDGVDKDNEPTSPFQVALAECLGEDNSKDQVDLNVTIPLTSYKRTEIDINDADLVAYRDAYDYKLWTNHGMAAYYTPYEYGVTPYINLRFAVASDGIGEYDSVGAIFWEIYRVDDYWKVKINANLAEFRWDGVHQVLRYLSPDGDALYQLIYEDFYTGRLDVIADYDGWYSYENSQIYQEDTENMGYVIYRFK